MKPVWAQKPQVIKEIEREVPRSLPEFLPYECIFGRHRAELMHRGTAYCRTCYDEKNRTGRLLDP